MSQKIKNTPYLKLTSDVSFKKFFEHPSVAIPMLQNFLPLSKEKKITSLEFLKSEITSEHKDSKNPVLDIRARLNSGEHVNIEMQSVSMTNFQERIAYYLCSLYASQLKRGESYSKLCPAYSIVFADFVVFPEFERYCTYFCLQALCRKSKKPLGAVFSKDLGIILVELGKFNKSGMENIVENEEFWCYLIKNSRYLSEEELEVLSEKGGGMKEATKRLSMLSEDESLRRIEEAREKARRDEVARMAYRKQQGIEQGIKQGIQQGRKEVASNLLKRDTDISFISEITGLSREEIESLKKS